MKPVEHLQHRMGGLRPSTTFTFNTGKGLQTWDVGRGDTLMLAGVVQDRENLRSPAAGVKMLRKTGCGREKEGSPE